MTMNNIIAFNSTENDSILIGTGFAAKVNIGHYLTPTRRKWGKKKQSPGLTPGTWDWCLSDCDTHGPGAMQSN